MPAVSAVQVIGRYNVDCEAKRSWGWSMQLDVRGEICPYPQVKTIAALKQLMPSDRLEVLADHPPALETVPAQAARLGYVSEIKEVGAAEWCIVLRKG
jgi:tRNA 2-thiouridine synthesizing protein A